MGGRALFFASWVLLAVLAAAVVFFSVTSTMGAFGRGPDYLTPAYSIDQLATVSDEAALAIRGRRVTAATWAMAYALMLLYVVLVPYRRGERWAWWAVLLSMGIAQLFSVARVVGLGTQQGAGTSGILLVVVILALAAGAPRMFAKKVEEPPPAE